MAYYRKYTKKAKAKPKAKVKSQLATKAYVQKIVKRPTELKCFSENSYSGAGLNIGVIRFTQILSNIVQGSNYGNRIGDQINLKKISIFHRFRNPNPDVPVYVRFLVAFDKSTRDGLDVGEDIFRSRDATENDPVNHVADGRTDQIHMPINHLRYQVLLDKSIKLGLPQPSNDSNLPSEKWIIEDIKCERVVKYISGSIVPGTSNFPNLYIMWFLESQGNLGALTLDIENSYCWKVWYTDS